MDVRNSVTLVGELGDLDLTGLMVLQGNRRSTFGVKLPKATCKALVEAETITVYPGPDQQFDAETDFRVYATDDRGKKIDPEVDPDAEYAEREMRKAEREAASQRRRDSMLVIYYVFPMDLAKAKMSSPIFTTIKERIK